jgi:hypothetical protein
VNSNNLFEDIAQNLQRKGLLIHFHRRRNLSILCKLPVYGKGLLEVEAFYYLRLYRRKA